MTAGTTQMITPSPESNPGSGPFKNMSYNIKNNAVDDHTSVSRVYSDIGGLVYNKTLPQRGAPALPGQATAQIQSLDNIPIINPTIDPSFNCRYPPTGKQHPEWPGSISDKWMDSKSGRYNSRHIVHTHVRNGLPDTSFTRNGFSYSSLPYVYRESRRAVQSWVPDAVEAEWKPCRRPLIPPHIRDKEQIESCKWTNKPAYVGKWGLGADRKPSMHTQSTPTLVPLKTRNVVSPSTRRSRALVRSLEWWERTSLNR